MRPVASPDTRLLYCTQAYSEFELYAISYLTLVIMLIKRKERTNPCQSTNVTSLNLMGAM